MSSKSGLAHALGISRSSLYYLSKKEQKDWRLKGLIEEVLRIHPSYGSRRIALELQKNRKGIKRVMRVFGIKPYRRRGRKYLVIKRIKVVYPNLLMHTIPSSPNHLWAADFTELHWCGRKVYVATVIDLFTRQILGIGIATRKGAALTLQALYGALFSSPRAAIFHSDNGSEYDAGVFKAVLAQYGISISRSHPGCPWENGYQESFYDKFKVDLGDPNRCKTLGELVALIYRTIWEYNHTRIHTALKMSPSMFAKQYLLTCPKGV